MKKGRHEIILELIKNNDIENQNELATKLNEKGFDVTQATVSRDIQKLNLIKVKNGEKSKYAVVERANDFQDKYVRIVKETIKDLKTAKNLLIIKTQVGMAMATAAAIDGMNFKEVIGSIAGDDIIFIATSDDDMAMILKQKIEVIIGNAN